MEKENPKCKMSKCRLCQKSNCSKGNAKKIKIRFINDKGEYVCNLYCSIVNLKNDALKDIKYHKSYIRYDHINGFDLINLTGACTEITVKDIQHEFEKWLNAMVSNGRFIHGISYKVNIAHHIIWKGGIANAGTARRFINMQTKCVKLRNALLTEIFNLNH